MHTQVNFEHLDALKNYFKQQDSVLAFWYGSSVKGQATEESDIDLAVYLKDKSQEDRIWSDVSRLLKAEIDLVVLNDAPATLISTVMKTGIPLNVKDRHLYWNLYLEKTLEAEDFAEFAEDYWKISERAHSLSPEDKNG